MKSDWKIFITDRKNLRTILNLLLVNREAEVTISRREGLVLVLTDHGKESEILKYIEEELGNKVEACAPSIRWRENVFLLNKPKFSLFSVFPFLLETSFCLVNGDSIHLKTVRYKTVNPFRKRILGTKGKRLSYRMSIYTPVLLRDYSSKEGKQCLTYERRSPLILTSFEVSSLINGVE